jgi:hypothetical protein
MMGSGTEEDAAVLEILPAPDYVVALRVNGRIERDDVECGIAAVEDALARQERVALYAEVAVTGMTSGAPSTFTATALDLRAAFPNLLAPARDQVHDRQCHAGCAAGTRTPCRSGSAHR